MKTQGTLQWIRQSSFFSSTAFLLYGLATLFAVFNTHTIAATVGNWYEDAAWALSPSAERAFAYGQAHFNARQSTGTYDIDRATFFLHEALRLDPSLPYIHHEIARVYFLKGDYWNGLYHINVQIDEHGSSTPNSYYVRGLIRGYMGHYADAVEDYKEFLKVDPHNWAAVNDLAWVLLKDNRPQEAADATEDALKFFPENPWLLNSSAIALYEIGEIEKAHERVQKAWAYVQNVSEREWLHSYPGNDPAIAGEGIATFHDAVSQNMQRIQTALAANALR